MNNDALPPTRLRGTSSTIGLQLWCPPQHPPSPPKLRDHLNALADIRDTVPVISLLDHSVNEYLALSGRELVRVDLDIRRKFTPFTPASP